MKLFSFKKKKPANIKAEEVKRKRRPSEGKKGVFEGKKKEVVVKEDAKPTKAISKPNVVVSQSSSEVLIRPRVTEKASDIASDSNGYAFDVLPSATKTQIKEAVKEVYKVTPEKVRIVPVPSKRVRGRRGEGGVKHGGKKAYVYLKRGDSIEFV